MDSGLKLGGIMAATAIVLSNDSQTLVKAAARLAKVVFGSRIQICDGTADDVEIQAAIDALTTGKVTLLGGTFALATNLDVDVALEGMGSEQTTIILADGVSITIGAGGSIAGIKIGTVSGYTGNALVVEAPSASLLLKQKIWDDVYLYCGADSQEPELTGTGVLLNCVSAAGTRGLATCGFGGITINGFEYGMNLRVSAAGGATAFMSGNIFDSIIINDSVYCLTFTKVGSGGSEGINGNIFKAVQVQCGASTARGVYVDGNDNKFLAVMVWDNPGVINEVEIASGSLDTFIIGMFYTTSDSGTRTIMIGGIGINYTSWGGDINMTSGHFTLPSGYGLGIWNKGYTVSGSIITQGVVSIYGQSNAYTLPDPGAARKFLLIFQETAGSDTVTTATAGGFDGTNNTATFNAEGDALFLYSVSATRWIILANVGVDLTAV